MVLNPPSCTDTRDSWIATKFSISRKRPSTKLVLSFPFCLFILHPLTQLFINKYIFLLLLTHLGNKEHRNVKFKSLVRDLSRASCRLPWFWLRGSQERLHACSVTTRNPEKLQLCFFLPNACHWKSFCTALHEQCANQMRVIENHSVQHYMNNVPKWKCLVVKEKLKKTEKADQKTKSIHDRTHTCDRLEEAQFSKNQQQNCHGFPSLHDDFCCKFSKMLDCHTSRADSHRMTHMHGENRPFHKNFKCKISATKTQISIRQCLNN